MACVTYEGIVYSLEAGESILSGLKRHGVQYPHACQSGVCQSCLAKVTSGDVLSAWQLGIKPVMQAQAYILPCIAKPEYDLTIAAPLSTEGDAMASILALRLLSARVLSVHLLLADLSIWTPGKYLNFVNSDGLIRSYSIANLAVEDGYIELHVKIYPDGAMSQWFLKQAKIGSKVRLRGPHGDCVYHNPLRRNFNMLLVGTGTGLAPLMAIAKDALAQKHVGKIHILHGGVMDDDIYHHETLCDMARQHANFYYENCVLNPSSHYPQAKIDQKMRSLIKDPTDLNIYICGPSDMTKQLKTQAFLAGIPSSAIYSDAFI